MTEESTGKKGQGRIYLILILLLLGLNAWLFYNAYQNKEDRKQSEQQIDQAKQLYADLNVKYDNTLQELEAQKGESDQKDSLIAQLENDLQQRKNEIAGLLQTKNFMSSKLSDAQKKLDEAQAKITEMEAERTNYKAQLDSLTAQYNALQGNYDSLQIQYTGEVNKGMQLSREKDSIASLGKIVLANNITVTGVRTKSGGKEMEDQNAKKTERLKICFTLMQNRLSADSQQKILVKVVDPDGATLWLASQGSGEFDNLDNGERSKYTCSITVDYKGNGDDNYCVYWEQNTGFTPGNYQVQVFNNGYEVGRNSFTLKKSFF